MSNAKDKQDRIRQRIEASQDRLTRESEVLPALPPRRVPADAYPPEDWRTLAIEHPWLVVAAGAGAGLLAGALLPRKAGSKLTSRALGLATVGAELAMALSRNARDAAAESAREGLARIDEGTAPLPAAPERPPKAPRAAPAAPGSSWPRKPSGSPRSCANRTC